MRRLHYPDLARRKYDNPTVAFIQMGNGPAYEDGKIYEVLALWHPAFWRDLWVGWKGKRLWAIGWSIRNCIRLHHDPDWPSAEHECPQCGCQFIEGWTIG